jgi:hypothetical protein
MTLRGEEQAWRRPTPAPEGAAEGYARRHLDPATQPGASSGSVRKTALTVSGADRMCAAHSAEASSALQRREPPRRRKDADAVAGELAVSLQDELDGWAVDPVCIVFERLRDRRLRSLDLDQHLGDAFPGKQEVDLAFLFVTNEVKPVPFATRRFQELVAGDGRPPGSRAGRPIHPRPGRCRRSTPWAPCGASGHWRA